MTEGASLLQGLFSLAVVGALLWIAARFARRFAPGSTAAAPLRTVATLGLGTRERIVVVEAGEQWLLVGVSPAGMRTLHVMPRGELPQAHPAPFADSIAAALKRIGNKDTHGYKG